MLKLLTTFLLLIVVFEGLHSQVQVIDSLTNNPIPYVRLQVVGTDQGILSDYNGYIHIDSTFNQEDSIVLSCIGYEPKQLTIHKLLAHHNISLSPTVLEFNDVIVSEKKGKFKLVNLGINKKPKTKFFDYSVTAQNGTIRAVYIPNEYSISGVLKTVNLYVTENGFPDAHFRIHVYGVSSLAIKPDQELTTSNIISSGTNGNEWISLDLTNERIIIPENGCFIGVEWFDHPKSIHFQDTLKNKGVTMVDGKLRDTTYTHIRSGNGIVLGSRSESYKFAKNKLWYKTHPSEEWINWCTSTTDESNFNIPDTLPNGYTFIRDENNTFYKVPCINAVVSFPKEKVDLKYNDPKNWKLNRLERVKKDDFTYPQASVSELFNSLIKAVENDDIIYILKYLCVYADDELDYILSTMKNNEDSLGEYFSAEEKERIIRKLRSIIETIEEDSLFRIDNHHYELKVNNDLFNLVLSNGIWKINPYSHRIIK